MMKLMINIKLYFTNYLVFFTLNVARIYFGLFFVKSTKAPSIISILLVYVVGRTITYYSASQTVNTVYTSYLIMSFFVYKFLSIKFTEGQVTLKSVKFDSFFFIYLNNYI